MKNAIICDTTTMTLVGMLAEVEAEEPPSAENLGDGAPVGVVEETARVHSRWEEAHWGTVLMLSMRLVTLAREQLIEQ